MGNKGSIIPQLKRAYENVFGRIPKYQTNPNSWLMQEAGNIAIKVRSWQGKYPGETTDEKIAAEREMIEVGNKDLTKLSKYFDKLGIYVKPEGNVDRIYSDWFNIFTIYKTYVEPDPDGSKSLLPHNTEYKKPEQVVVDVHDGQVREEALNDTNNSSDGDLSSYNNNINLTEEETMPVEVNQSMNVGDVLSQAQNVAGTGVPSVDYGNVAAKMTANQAPQVSGSNTVSAEDASAAVNMIFNQEDEKKRIDFTKNHKIVSLVIGNMPVKDRVVVAEGKDAAYGTLPNPTNFRANLLGKLFKEEGMNDVDVAGKDSTGEYKIPACVQAIGSDNVIKYKAFMDELNQACDSENHQIKVNMSKNFGSWKAVIVADESKDPQKDSSAESVYSWKEAKTLLVRNTVGKLKDGVDGGVVIQIKSVSPYSKKNGHKKNIKSAEDLVVIQVVNKDQLIDTESGNVASNSGNRIQFVNVISDKSKTVVKGGVRSVLNFKYRKKANPAEQGSKDRDLTTSMMLQCLQYETSITNPALNRFKAAGGVGAKAVEASTEDALLETRKTFQNVIGEGFYGDDEMVVSVLNKVRGAQREAEVANVQENADQFM